jgi:hypothetical protein
MFVAATEDLFDFEAFVYKYNNSSIKKLVIKN